MKLIASSKPEDADVVLARMSVNFDRAHSIYSGKAKPFDRYDNNFLTINKARVRGKPSDKIWLFGRKISSTTNLVFHSLLTDANNKVVADGQFGVFDPKHYTLPEGVLDLVQVIEVDDFLDTYFDYAMAVEAAPKPLADYTLFHLKRRLNISRGSKEYQFKRGDVLGWRLSLNGKNFRLVSHEHGHTVVFSIPITDTSWKWLVGHDPKARKRTVF